MKDFVIASMDDLRDTIRACDAKADILLVVLALPFAGIDSVWKGISQAWDLQFVSVYGWRLLILFGFLCWLLSFLFALFVVAPVHNPVGKVRDVPKGLGTFYAGHLYKFKLWRPFYCPLCAETVTEHLASLPREADAELLELTYEKMKLAYIVGRKIAMYKRATFFTFFATLTVETAKGKIVIKLNPDGAPNTIKNLKSKADAGFFNGLTFHRVEDWVIQGGDPDGTGAGGGKIASEYNKTPFKRSSVGIARGPDRAQNSDCQWFVCKKDALFLTGDYTNIGEVVSGMEVVDKIAQGDKMTKVTITESAPATQPAK